MNISSLPVPSAVDAIKDSRQEWRFRILFDQAPLGIVLLDPVSGRIHRANQGFANILGRPALELEGMDWISLTHPEDIEDNRLGLARLNAGEISSYRTVKRYLRPEGTVVWVNLTSSWVQSDGVKPAQILSVVEDITERRKAEQRIKELNATLEQRVQERTNALLAEIAERRKTELELSSIKANLEAALASMDEALLIIDRQGRIAFYNDAYARFIKFTVKAELSHCLKDYQDIIQISTLDGLVIPPEQWPVARGLGGHKATGQEFLMRRLDTGETWLGSCSYAPIFDDMGLIIGVVVVARDITQSREAERRLRASEQSCREINANLELLVAARTAELRYANRALREREQSLKFILDGSRLGTWDWDLSTGLIKRNDYWAEMLGYRLSDIEDCTSETCRRLMHPDDLDRACQALRDHLIGISPCYEVEFRLRAADGSYHWILDRGQVVSRDEQGDALRMSGTHEDISQRKQLEADLYQARDLAERANAAKTEFLARMSHEIRTPLYSMLGLAQMIGHGPLSQSQDEMVGRVQEAGESLLHIINDILDLAKIEAGNLRIEAGPFLLSDLLSRISGLLGPTARNQGLELRLEVPPLPPDTLVGDSQRLEQVLINLIGNAIKFTQQGEVVLQLQVLKKTEDEVRLRFAVRDTGIGIAPGVLANLFTPFTQGEGGNSRRFGGTGLGLAISKRLVELMGGKIGAESQPGRGSTFWFLLPLGRLPAPPPPRPGPATSLAPERGMAGLHFLVVDDSAEHRDLLAQALTLAGAGVTQAEDGVQALDYLKTHAADCDLVLMDLQMPVMDGFLATRLIRQELGLLSLPIIAVTAGVLPEQRQAALDAGVDDILTKPLDLNRIAADLWPWVRHPALPASHLPGDCRSMLLPPCPQ